MTTTLKPAPTQTRIPDGTIRWLIDVIDGVAVMKTGEMRTETREKMMGFGDITESHFRFGPPAVGGKAPQRIGTGCRIDPTDTPDIFIVSAYGIQSTETLSGPEIFTDCGFIAPCED